jgi:hypothetical protein
MNFFSWDKAISLYPYATFEQNVSLRCVPASARIDQVLEKYRSRGFHILGPENVSNLQSESHIPVGFGNHSRHIGDSFSWIIDLNTIDVNIPRRAFASSKLFGNAWNFAAHQTSQNRPVYRVSYLVLKHIILRYPYTASIKSYRASLRDLEDLRDVEFLRLPPDDQRRYIEPFFRHQYIPSTESQVPWR